MASPGGLGLVVPHPSVPRAYFAFYILSSPAPCLLMHKPHLCPEDDFQERKPRLTRLCTSRLARSGLSSHAVPLRPFCSHRRSTAGPGHLRGDGLSSQPWHLRLKAPADVFTNNDTCRSDEPLFVDRKLVGKPKLLIQPLRGTSALRAWRRHWSELVSTPQLARVKP